MDECKPLIQDGTRDKSAQCDLFSVDGNHGRRFHAFTSQLKLSAFHGMGDALRGCVAHDKGLLGDI